MYFKIIEKCLKLRGVTPQNWTAPSSLILTVKIPFLLPETKKYISKPTYVQKWKSWRIAFFSHDRTFLSH